MKKSRIRTWLLIAIVGIGIAGSIVIPALNLTPDPGIFFVQKQKLNYLGEVYSGYKLKFGRWPSSIEEAKNFGIYNWPELAIDQWVFTSPQTGDSVPWVIEINDDDILTISTPWFTQRDRIVRIKLVPGHEPSIEYSRR